MNELLDEILSNENIKMNEALAKIHKYLVAFNKELEKEVKLDIIHAFLGDSK